MMLKLGICCMGLAFGIALFIPRYDWGLITVVSLLILSMILVLIAKTTYNLIENGYDQNRKLNTDDRDVAAPEAGPEAVPEARKQELSNPKLDRGRHSKN